jgi:hypothetical protein
MSKDNPVIYSKVSEVMSLVKAIGKGRKNVQQGYSFRGIDDLYNELNEHLSKAGIFFTSEVLEQKREERQSAKGGTLIYTVLRIKWTVYAEDGSSVTTETVGEAMDSGDKSCNKAMSAAYKYALMQLFCIPTDEPKDTENETHEIAPKTQSDFEIEIQMSSTMEGLKKVWLSIPPALQEKLAEKKQAAKERIELETK